MACLNGKANISGGFHCPFFHISSVPESPSSTRVVSPVVSSLVSDYYINTLPNMNHGTVAIAVVQHQVMIIQAVRAHDCGDRWLDVYTYTPFGDHIFLASSVPHARIASSDVLIVFPFRTATTDMIELPAQAYQKFMQLKANHQKKQENLWRGWKATGRLR